MGHTITQVGTSKMPGHVGQKLTTKRVDTSTLSGLKAAERLKNKGWTIGSSSLFWIEFYKLG